MPSSLKVTKYSLGALMYLIAWCVSPPLAYGHFYRFLAVVAVCMLISMQFRLANKTIQNTYLAMVAFIGYILVVMFLVGDSYVYRIGTIILIALMICSLHIENSDYSEKYQFLLTFTFLLCILWNLTSLRGIAAHPGIMRILAKNSADSAMYASRGVGGYGYIYTILLMIPLAGEICQRTQNRKFLRYCAGGFLVTSYLVIMKSAYFMAEILSVMAIPLYFVFQKKNSPHRVAFIFLVVILTGVLLIFADSILLTLHELVGIRSIKAKLWDTYQLLNGTEAIENSEFATRHRRYWNSLTYTLTHPLFGGLRYIVTGNHSHLLDMGAQYGLLILWWYIYMMYQPMKRMMVAGSTAVQLVLLLLVAVVTMNTAPFALGAVLFIVMPIYVKLYQQQQLISG